MPESTNEQFITAIYPIWTGVVSVAIITVVYVYWVTRREIEEIEKRFGK